MAIRKIETVEDNTGPPLLITAERDGVVINLTGSTVELIIAKGTTITNAGHQACTIITPTSGVVQYDMQVGDFATPGNYKADLRIIYGDGTYEVLYEQLKFKVRARIQ